MRRLIRRYPVWAFFAITIALGWIAVAVGMVALPVDPEEGVSIAHVLLVFCIASPSVVGILLTWVVDGREGLRALFARAGRWRVHPLWYGAALLVPISMFGLARVLQGLLGGPRAPVDFLGQLPFFIPVAIMAPLLEEFGWRGYALPRLQRRHNALVSALLVGVGWALWHAAVNYLGKAASAGTMLLPLLLLATQYNITESILLSWIHNSTGNSMLLVLLCHFAITFSNIFGLPNPSMGDEIRATLVSIAIHWLVVIAIVVVTGPARLARGVRSTRET